jgi:predicted nucleic acid-binding protein
MNETPLTIDTSAVIAVIVGESSREQMIERTAGTTLLAPESLDAEIGNAFSAMFRRGRLTLSQARQAVALFDLLPIRRVPLALEPALELSHRLGIYAYDAYVLNCALQQRTALLTLDRGQAESASRLGISVLEVTR